MNDAHITYVGSANGTPHKEALHARIWRKLPKGFLVVVGVPTLAASFYYGVIASPMYVSESSFVVRSASQNQLNSFGMALQGIGISSQASDAFAVHSFMTSRDGLTALKQKFDVKGVLSRPGADAFQRYPNVFEKESNESLFKAMKRFVVVGYDSQTGVSTLRSSAFNPKDAQLLAQQLLLQAETRVNQLNDRVLKNSAESAERRVAQATQNLATAQAELTAFRTQNSTPDPTREASMMGQVVAELLTTVAKLQAEHDQLAAEAPQSPQLPSLRARIAALKAQVEQERSAISGTGNSLSQKIGRYEELLLNSEIAGRELATAKTAYEAAEQAVGKQQLYLETISAPSLPDSALEPKRLRSILTVLLCALLVYGAGWLAWASIREHRQIT